MKVAAIADSATTDDQVRLPAALAQPVAGADVVARPVELATAAPPDEAHRPGGFSPPA